MDTTLDAWEILQTVVQLGGFAPAAEKLNRSQSTISYAIGRLQSQLGVRLFEIQGRKAQLTELGRVLLADAEPHLAGFHRLEQNARLMASGGAPEIRLSVDSIFPDDRLFAALASFSSSFPYAKPKLRQGSFLSERYGDSIPIAAIYEDRYAVPLSPKIPHEALVKSRCRIGLWLSIAGKAI
jgi:DNA-binding transcriptional LysR family regulator